VVPFRSLDVSYEVDLDDPPDPGPRVLVDPPARTVAAAAAGHSLITG